MKRVEQKLDSEVREVTLGQSVYRIQVVQQNDDLNEAAYQRADYFRRSGDEWMLVGSTRLASNLSELALDQAEEILRKDPNLQLTRDQLV
ncbi:MAG: hypothetical protein IT209_11785 [Armatimonadetes bacterium]|nr:hypothetical protein [Armatimonadota bacterium]